MREKRSRLRIYNEPVQYVSKYFALHNHYNNLFYVENVRGRHTHTHTFENADVA